MYIKSPLRRITGILDRNSVPDSRDLEKSLEQVLFTLNSEEPDIRPKASDGNPGGLILLNSLPTIIVPDLHARMGYLRALLSWIPPDANFTVYQGLLLGKLQIVCVGDGFHSEARGIPRWKTAFKEFSSDYKKHKSMDEEMLESLGVMMIVMELKAAFPENFHFLKGNHENVANEESADNRPFRKFVYEGAMVTSWFHKFMNEETYRKYYMFEKKLPVFAVGDRFCVTHAEPRKHYKKNELIDAMIHREVVFDLTWTANDEAEENSVIKYLEEYFPGDNQSLMFGGHRPVPKFYKTRAFGRYLQIHNPDQYIAVYMNNILEFSTEKNILILPKKGEA
ncbi:MAG: metallophosphoesterase [Spirochaetia bacterium]|jgi:hypothetical protein|nr:metallophosphoesterase [Spirochaetia bacterium]